MVATYLARMYEIIDIPGLSAEGRVHMYRASRDLKMLAASTLRGLLPETSLDMTGSRSSGRI
jgi:hypothetical protein